MECNCFRVVIAGCSLIAGLLSSSCVQALDLLESYQAAQSEDAEYRAAQSAADAGHEAVPMARAQLLPNVSLNASRFQNDLRRRDNLDPANQNPPIYSSLSANLVLRQPLYRPYQYAAYRQSQSQMGSVDAALDKARQDSGGRVSSAYFNVLLAEEGERYVLSQKRSISAQLAAAKRALAAGQGTRTDVDDAQARLDLNQAQELASRQQIQQARHELQILINRPVETLNTIDFSRMEMGIPLPSNLDAWIQRTETNSPDLRDARAKVEVAHFDVDRARSGHKPTLDLIAQRTLSQSDNITNPQARYQNDQIGVQLAMPIYSGGYVNAQVRQALAAETEAQMNYESVRRKLSAAVRKEYQAIEEGILKVRALEQAEHSGNQAVISNQKGFLAGTRTRLDILDAEEKRNQTHLDLVRERLNFVMARIRLLSLAGDLDIEQIKKINDWLVRQ